MTEKERESLGELAKRLLDFGSVSPGGVFSDEFYWKSVGYFEAGKELEKWLTRNQDNAGANLASEVL